MVGQTKTSPMAGLDTPRISPCRAHSFSCAHIWFPRRLCRLSFPSAPEFAYFSDLARGQSTARKKRCLSCFMIKEARQVAVNLFLIKSDSLRSKCMPTLRHRMKACASVNCLQFDKKNLASRSTGVYGSLRKITPAAEIGSYSSCCNDK